MVVKVIGDAWKTVIPEETVQIQKTRREFEGDFTIVVFPLLKISRQSPEETAEVLGKVLVKESDLLAAYQGFKGFLNLNVSRDYW